MDQELRTPNDEISLVQIVSVLLQQRKLVIIVLFISLSISLVTALRKPTLYTSSASFFPEGSTSGSSTLSSLALQFGIAAPGGRDERNPEFYQDIISSRELLRGIVTQPFSVRWNRTEAEQINLIAYYEVPATTEEEGIQRAIERLIPNIQVNFAAVTGILVFSVTTKDPGLSEQVVRAILEAIYTFDRVSRQSQAGAERRFVEDRLAQVQDEFQEAEDSLKIFLTDNRIFTNSPELQFEHDRLVRAVQMRQELVTSLAESFETARIEEVRSTPLITVIDQPRAAPFRNPKGRIRTMIRGGVLGLILGGLVAFLNHYKNRARERRDPQLDELSSLWRKLIRDVTRLGRDRSERSS